MEKLHIPQPTATMSRNKRGMQIRASVFRMCLWWCLCGIAVSSFTRTRGMVAAVGDTTNLDQYMYLQEGLAKISPLLEYKADSADDAVAGRTGGRDPSYEGKEPAFLYDPNYPYPRVVEFYAHWCPHCQHFKPKYIQFAKEFSKVLEQQNDTQQSSSSSSSPLVVEVWAVSCVPNRKICSDFSIRSYPSIKLFPAHSNEGSVLKYWELHPLQLLRELAIHQGDASTSDKTKPTSNASPQQKQEQQPRNESPLLPQQQQQQQNGYFMHRSKQQVFRDAHLSFMFLMKTAIYTTSSGPLEDEKKNVLRDFLKVLQYTMPPASSLQPVLNDLLEDFGELVAKSPEGIEEVLARHSKLPSPQQVGHNEDDENHWSPACTQHGTGFTCGLWQLFHIMTIGVVEWNLVSTDVEQRLIPSHVANALHLFVEQFFLCEECRIHFVHDYQSCAYDRCSRLIDYKKKASIHHWIQLPLWLYETHNGVNERLRSERIENKEENESTYTNQQILWPPIEECPRCWVLSQGRWEEEMVYRYLRLTYWPEDHLSEKYRKELQSGAGTNENNNQEDYDPQGNSLSFPSDAGVIDHTDTLGAAGSSNNAKKVIIPGTSTLDGHGHLQALGDEDYDIFETVLSPKQPVLLMGLALTFFMTLACFMRHQRKRRYDAQGYHKKRECDDC